MQTMQFHFQRCKARGSLKVSLGREIIAALHDCAKFVWRIEQTDIYVGKGRVKENVLVRMAGRL